MVAAAVLLLTACSSTGVTGDTAAGGERRGSLAYVSDQTPDTYNPVMLVEHTNPVTEMVFRGLVGHDADNKVVPALASEWTVSDDGLAYDFTLRDDVTWHDGEPFTADDVVFTLDQVRDPATEAAVAPNFDAVSDITAADDTDVRIELSEPYTAMLDVLTMGILSEHALSGSSVTDPDFGIAPVGTGPFRLVGFKNVGIGWAAVETPVGRLIRRGVASRDLAAAFAAQLSLSHACWLVTYPGAGWLGGISLSATAIALAGVAGCATLVSAWLWQRTPVGERGKVGS